MQNHPLVRNFTVAEADVEFLMNLLLEQERPASTEKLALALLQKRLEEEQTALAERYKDTKIYRPADGYQIGERLLFPAFDFAPATVVKIRTGNNEQQGLFNVIAVEFEGETGKIREFAADYTREHLLNQSAPLDEFADSGEQATPEELLGSGRRVILKTLEERLRATSGLAHIAGEWFPTDLLIEVNAGHLHLAEAVLDINSGGPMSTEQILQEIGGIDNAPMPLQVFSMNYIMREDSRFDEVGPTGEVLWYLSRLEPQEVLHTPEPLRYHEIEFDESLLSPQMSELEIEINDEMSDLDLSGDEDEVKSATIVLTYPHRRVGTVPLNSLTDRIFPTARRTPRVSFTLVDGHDGEEYPGWVVRKDRYVFGLNPIYRKHQLPIGGYLTLRRGEPGKIIVDFTVYRPRTEWIRMLVPKGDSFTFENNKRAIGADYDDLSILGIDDLAALDELIKHIHDNRRNLTWLLRTLIPALSRLSPQGTAHAKTIYSALNVLRRCPPGPMLATLTANPEFENVGGHYWRLRE